MSRPIRKWNATAAKWRDSFRDYDLPRRSPEFKHIRKEYKALINQLKSLGRFKSKGAAAEFARSQIKQIIPLSRVMEMPGFWSITTMCMNLAIHALAGVSTHRDTAQFCKPHPT